MPGIDPIIRLRAAAAAVSDDLRALLAVLDETRAQILAQLTLITAVLADLTDPEPEAPPPGPSPVPAPTGLTATHWLTETGQGMIRLTWDDDPTVDEWLLREPGTPGILAVLTQPHTTRGPLHTSQAYAYTVSAIVSGVESDAAAFPEVRFTTPTPDPDPVPDPVPSDPDEGDDDEDPAPEPEPDPGPPAGRDPWPTPGDVGCPHPRQILTPTAGGTLRTTRTGQVLTGIDHTGPIIVDHDDVTIQRSFLTATGSGIHIRVSAGVKRLVVQDCTLTGGGRANPTIAYSDYTLRRCEIRDYAEGPRMNGRSTVEDCWLHSFVQVGSNHTDALQSTGGTGVVVRRNYVQLYNHMSSNPFHNAAFQGGGEEKPLVEVVIEENLMDGGNFTINLGGGGTRNTTGVIRRNTLVGPRRFGVLGSIPPGVRLENNTII